VSDPGDRIPGWLAAAKTRSDPAEIAEDHGRLLTMAERLLGLMEEMRAEAGRLYAAADSQSPRTARWRHFRTLGGASDDAAVKVESEIAIALGLLDPDAELE
jgi:hypothetical protein